MDTGIVEFAMHFILVARSGQDFQERFDASDGGGVVIRRQEHSSLMYVPTRAQAAKRNLAYLTPSSLFPARGRSGPASARVAAAQYIDAEPTLLGLEDSSLGRGSKRLGWRCRLPAMLSAMQS